MSEIKFRALLRNQHFKGWVYCNILDGFRGLDVDINTICQYTGLKDKNGKEIYDGDVVRSDRHRTVCKIVFQYGAFRFDLGTKKYAVEIECEVIGNIYENPELLINNQ